MERLRHIDKFYFKARFICIAAGVSLFYIFAANIV